MSRLAIIIVNWNTRDLLAQCLQSIEMEMRVCRDIGTFVVDNASQDGSVQMVRSNFPWVHLIANDVNIGFARANNQAIQRSDAQFVMLLNSDTEVHSGALRSVLDFMEGHPDAGGCGARLLNADGSLQASCHPVLTPAREFWRLTFLDRLWPKATYTQENWDLNQPHQVEVIKGACLVLRRMALDEVGLLDERYFMYTEEMDLCYRLLQARWTLWWVPQAVITHYGEASSRQVAEDMYVQLYKSKIQFHRKFGGQRRVKCFKRLLLLVYWPRLILASLGANFRPQFAVRARTYRRLLSELTMM